MKIRQHHHFLITTILKYHEYLDLHGELQDQFIVLNKVFFIVQIGLKTESKNTFELAKEKLFTFLLNSNGTPYLHRDDLFLVLFEKSLFIYQNHLSKNYVGLARALGYVGDIHRELGNYEKAKLYLEKSYYLYKNHFPNNKPGIVWNLAHLGENYGILGYTDKAKTILEECLGICKDHLSENHAYSLAHRSLSAI